jgi:hypothetical protein
MAQPAYLVFFFFFTNEIFLISEWLTYSFDPQKPTVSNNK